METTIHIDGQTAPGVWISILVSEPWERYLKVGEDTKKSEKNTSCPEEYEDWLKSLEIIALDERRKLDDLIYMYL